MPGLLLSERIYSASVAEVTAPKLGNVHPGAQFHDLTFADFVRSAEVVAPVLANAGEIGVGRAIWEAVRVTQTAVGKNTNLGIILLLAPLAAISEETALSEGIGSLLERLTVEDADWTYRAIRLAAPGGMGNSNEQDLSQTPTLTLQEVMSQAQHRDRIAWQYAHNFDDIFQRGVPWLQLWRQCGLSEEQAIVGLQLQLMAAIPDSLIARKCGVALAQEASHRAAEVLALNWPNSSESLRAAEKLDDWLRSDGNRLNPGTTADLIAAILFAAASLTGTT